MRFSRRPVVDLRESILHLQVMIEPRKLTRLPDSVSTWTTKLSDQIMTRVLSDDEYLRHRSQIYKQRLATAYEETTAFLSKHQIRFDPANAGLFIWIDLRAWLLLPIPGSDPKLSVDIQLTYFLLQRGVFLEPGEVGAK